VPQNDIIYNKSPQKMAQGVLNNASLLSTE
jgi:hypothetical protein